MIPELGHFALILALCMAIVQATLPVIGAAIGQQNWVAVARPAAQAHFLMVVLATACLLYAFITSDFSVAYVARNSNTALPLIYKISALWGAHEGSLLLWALILVLWSNAVLWFSKSLPDEMVARVISVLGMVSIGFLLFMLLTSNPFERLFPVPMEGNDLNPLLQDPGLAIHPPMLYMGYVGFAVPFAFAIAAMLGGKLDTAWARWSRPWTNIAWMFLTLGISLGSWWAYYELGWGGWWFWDPVENASFMPWIVGTALMHSLAVTEKRGAFKAWTVLLAIFAFSLSLLGTFLVRSGVLTSVHAFATDPERGTFILIFLSLVIGLSFFLYAIRAPKIKSTAQFETISSETALLLNNVILVALALSILLGTLYPIALDAFNLGKISVGPPYFDKVFIWLTTPLAVLLGFGVVLRWKKDSTDRVLKLMRIPMLLSVVLAVFWVAVLTPAFNFMATIGITLAIWIIASNIQALRLKLQNKENRLQVLKTLPRGFYGMTLAHIGVGVFTIGIVLTSTYSTEKDVRLMPGDSYNLGGFDFRFDGVTQLNGPNYIANQGLLHISRDGEEVAIIKPQKRIYRVQQSPMTEAAIDAGLTRDLFVALGEPLGEKGAWSVRLYHKPFIRWIWLGTIFMGLGALLAATDRRYRLAAKRKLDEPLPKGSVTAGAA